MWIRAADTQTRTFRPDRRPGEQNGGLSRRVSRRKAVLSWMISARATWPALACGLALTACGGGAAGAEHAQSTLAGQGSVAGTTGPKLETMPVVTPVAGAAGMPSMSASPTPTTTTAGAAGVSLSAGNSALPAGAAGSGGAAGHGAHTTMAGTGAMHDAAAHCKLESTPDPRDAMLTDAPNMIQVGAQQDRLMPQIVLDWMDEHQFAEAHDGWHLVRKWDQSCRKSNATTCTAADRLVKQGLERAPIQQGAPGDGIAFMMMHRHMIAMLKVAFPTHTSLFDGFVKVPKSKSDAANPQPWRDISWTSNNLRGFDTLENIEMHLSQFATEDDLGQYIENTYRWTAQTPMSPVNAPGSGLHGALHSQWSVNGSPANLIQQAVDVKNHAFWKLHGWIDNVWERYRKAKGLKDDDPAYQKLLFDQCMEMYMLQPRNRDMPQTNPGTTTPDPTQETGMFATQVRPFLDSTCAGCHSAIAPSAGMTLGGPGISSAEIIMGLVGAKASNGEYNLIEPGSPQKSWVYLKASGDVATVTCTQACDRESMPPSGTGLNATQLMTLKQWIMSGATDK